MDARGAWRCELPATPLDLALRWPGHVPHYLWEVKVAKGTILPLGELTFQPGASMVGWVEVEEGGFTRDCKVLLLPQIAAGGSDPRITSRIRSTARRSVVSKTGFFQFAGIAPGAYVLEAEQPGFAPARAFPIEVWADRETALRQPLVLRRPFALQFTLEPRVDRFGEPWYVTVFRASSFSAGFDAAPIYEEDANPLGQVQIPDQSPGTFMVKVSDSLDNRVFFDPDLRVENKADAQRILEINVLRLSGELFLAEDPLAATLWFDGRNGALRTELAADAEGQFQGTLPRDGAWFVEVLAEDPPLETKTRILVEVDDQNEAFVSLRLPDTEVYGFVVDPSGRGIEGASVTANAAGKDTPSTRSGPGGEFTLRGFTPGPMSLAARFRSSEGPMTSDARLIAVSDSSPHGPIELPLKRTREISGSVVSPQGPVAGAAVVVRTWRPYHAGFSDTGRSNVNGRFTVRVAESAQILLAQVSPPGFALTTAVFHAEEAPRLEVTRAAGDLEVVLAENRMPVFFQNGLALDHQSLYLWAQGHGVSFYSSREWTARLPRVAPGEYRVCPVDRARTAQAAFDTGDWQQGLDENACQTGYLVDGSKLRLDLNGS